MGLDLLPTDLRNHYEVQEWKHACAILAQDFTAEWDDIIAVLRAFRLRKQFIEVGGGNKSKVAEVLDGDFYQRGWAERALKTSVVVDGEQTDTPTHKIDCLRTASG